MTSSPFAQWLQPECRIHGVGCAVPWGFDEEHSDQRVPYTVDQLASRRDCPHRYAYASAQDYLSGHRLWAALRRDGRLNPGERAAYFATKVEQLREIRDGAPLPELVDLLIKEFQPRGDS